MGDDSKQLYRPEVSTFLKKLSQTPAVKSEAQKARLLFALDATASRASTWDQACHLQGEMFQSALDLGGLDISVCYYRGYTEFGHSDWCSSEEQLAAFMRRVSCVGGHTQIERVLNHALSEVKNGKIKALVFVGDSMEEDPDQLCQLAGKIALYNVPIFCFQEGRDEWARIVFRSMAEISNGAHCMFESGSADELRNLLKAVSVYASGGYAALQDFNARFSKPVLLLPATVK